MIGTVRLVENRNIAVVAKNPPYHMSVLFFIYYDITYARHHTNRQQNNNLLCFMVSVFYFKQVQTFSIFQNLAGK